MSSPQHFDDRLLQDVTELTQQIAKFYAVEPPSLPANTRMHLTTAIAYFNDICQFFKSVENNTRSSDYMRSQKKINTSLRDVLSLWLIEMHEKFKLAPETLYLTLNIFDRYLSMEVVETNELLLVGVTAMFIAGKYEEELWYPQVYDFIVECNRDYSREQILAMEKRILNSLEWKLTVPTPYVFLVRFLMIAGCDRKLEHMTFFFAELGLTEYSMVMYSPSMFAAAAVYAARCTLTKSPLWPEQLKCDTGYSERQVLNCARILVKLHSKAPDVVHKKYSSPQLGAVALYAPATKLIAELTSAGEYGI